MHDVAIQKLPVRFAIDRAGLVGADGQTHAGAFDVTYLSCLPGMVVMAAGDEAELVHMVSTAVAYDEGPMAFRYPRGEGIGVEMPEAGEVLTIGKGRVLREGSKLALLSFGGRLAETLKAADELAAHGYPATVADARFAKPLDTDLVERLVKEHEVVITIEEASIGGFATQVLEYLAKNDLIQDGLKIRPMHLPDRFQDQASPFEMYDDAELNASHMGISNPPKVAPYFPVGAIVDVEPRTGLNQNKEGGRVRVTKVNGGKHGVPCAASGGGGKGLPLVPLFNPDDKNTRNQRPSSSSPSKERWGLFVVTYGVISAVVVVVAAVAGSAVSWRFRRPGALWRPPLGLSEHAEPRW